MNRFGLSLLCLVGGLLLCPAASATKSAELYTSEAYGYGRFEARMRVTAGDGVVSAFFLWKDGSEQPGNFWNELDYEKIGASCQLQTNALYGNPSANHTQKPTVSADLCGEFHVYGYEWTADYIVWSLDGAEIRRETGEAAAAYADNASAGMQIHFNIWPGDASFGGNFSPGILPVHQYIDWVQFSAYANGAFTVAWREDFDGSTVPSGWQTGDWTSPKNLSTHDPLNVNLLSGYAVLSMTADDATGPAGAMSGPDGETGGLGGTAGTGGTSGGGGTAGAAGGSSAGAAGMAGGSSAGGTAGTGGAADPGGGSSGTSAGQATGGAGGASAVGGASGSAATTGGASGAGAVSATGGSGAVAGGSSGSSSSGAAAQTGSGGATEGASSGGGSGQPDTGGAKATAGDGAKADDATGCTFRAPGSTRSSRRETGTGVALLLALAGAVRRRRGVV